MAKEDLKDELFPAKREALINPGTMSILYQYNDNGINCMVSFDKNNKIDYFLVDDSNFTTRDGLKIGDSMDKVKSLGGEILFEEGVCLFASLKSGWYAYLEFINFDFDMMEKTNIKFFYKKDPNDNFFFMTPDEYIRKYNNSKWIDDSDILKKIHKMEKE